MKSIYLDMNIYNRPFDDQSEVRVKLETIAVFSIMKNLRGKKYNLLWSFVLDYENSLNPSDDVKKEIFLVATVLAGKTILPDNEILIRAKWLEKKGIKPRDSLHIVCACRGGADYFITCDDDLIRKARKVILEMEILNPVDFVREMEVRQHD